MKKIVSSLFIIIGILLILSPFFNRQIIENRVTTTQEIVEEVTAEIIEANEVEEATFDYTAIKDVEITSTIAGSLKFENENIIGQLMIDDLDIELPILKGVTNSNLLAGAATMVPDMKMGEGNYSLAGHYMEDNLLFGGLLDIEIGTIVRITDKKMIYDYMIYDTQIVPDTSFYMLDNNRAEKRGKPIISLMTCYYTSKNGKRFFALGELVEEYPYDMIAN